MSPGLEEPNRLKADNHPSFAHPLDLAFPLTGSLLGCSLHLLTMPTFGTATKKKKLSSVNFYSFFFPGRKIDLF